MKFVVRPTANKDTYYVGIDSRRFIVSDEMIARVANIPFIEYINILKQFNAFEDELEQHFFNIEEDCYKAADCLNEKYGVMLTLMEEK